MAKEARQKKREDDRKLRQKKKAERHFRWIIAERERVARRQRMEDRLSEARQGALNHEMQRLNRDRLAPFHYPLELFYGFTNKPKVNWLREGF